MRARVIVLTIALLVAPALIAAATHNFGHRLVIMGRVVDSRGLPVSNEQVEVEIKGFTLGAPEDTACRSNPCRTTTGPSGDYRVFWHAHGIGDSGDAILRVRGQEFTDTYRTELRWTPVNGQIRESVPPASGAAQDWNRTYTVQGRVFQLGGGIPDAETSWVDGDVQIRTPVNITFTFPNGTTVVRNVTTSNYGDFFAQIRGTENFTNGQIQVETLGETYDLDFDPTYRTTIAELRIPPPPKEPFDPVPIIIVVAIVGGLGGLYFGGRKLKEKRDLKKARQRSGRKRANK